MMPIESFYRYYDVYTENTPSLIEEAQALRYRVYCLDRRFEDAARFPDRREQDMFDARAAHGIVRYRHDGSAAGAVRLVQSGDDEKPLSLPVELVAGVQMKEFLAQQADQLGRGSIAEISRLALLRERPGMGDMPTVASGNVLQAYSADSDSSHVFRQMAPYAVLGLFSAIVRLSVRCGISHWCALLEPTLLRLLSRYGIYFEKVGGVVNFRGVRQPVFTSIDVLLAGIFNQRPDVWRIITINGAIWPLNCDLVQQTALLGAGGQVA